MDLAASGLHPEDWANAALAAIAEGGLSAVAVETLASRLGATKGSFYWHFADRAAVIEAAVLAWEESVKDVIRTFAPVADPHERLRVLFENAFRRPHAGKVEAALTAEPPPPAVAIVLTRVTRRRIAFIAAALREIGFDAASARRRALVVYSAYLGTFSAQQASPRSVPRGRSFAPYLTELLEVLTTRG
jgi:AcrR family transcriptional regulator